MCRRRRWIERGAGTKKTPKDGGRTRWGKSVFFFFWDGLARVTGLGDGYNLALLPGEFAMPGSCRQARQCYYTGGVVRGQSKMGWERLMGGRGGGGQQGEREEWKGKGNGNGNKPAGAGRQASKQAEGIGNGSVWERQREYTCKIQTPRASPHRQERVVYLGCMAAHGQATSKRDDGAQVPSRPEQVQKGHVPGRRDVSIGNSRCCLGTYSQLTGYRLPSYSAKDGRVRWAGRLYMGPVELRNAPGGKEKARDKGKSLGRLGGVGVGGRAGCLEGNK